MVFDWNKEKARKNADKHGVSFDEAISVFNDPLFLTFADPKHSLHEKRFIIVGESAKGRLLMVAYTEREEVTRLISARPVTRKERKVYESDF
ncbi:MAG: BrnT family toxin [Cyanobacteria bacterium J06621_3]